VTFIASHNFLAVLLLRDEKLRVIFFDVVVIILFIFLAIVVVIVSVSGTSSELTAHC
jgi:hypothetical protein